MQCQLFQSLFIEPSLFFLKFILGVVLLDNSNWMRVGELFGGLDIEDGDPPSRKKGSAKISNS